LAALKYVGQQRFRLAKLVRQGADLGKHRFDLLLVVGRLNHLGGEDQKALRGHHRLRVVAPSKPAASPLLGMASWT
jgi:hypothetical protein